MFTHIYKQLKKDNLYNTSPEIEILKGWYEKPKNISEFFTKLNRKSKYKITK